MRQKQADVKSSSATNTAELTGNKSAAAVAQMVAPALQRMKKISDFKTEEEKLNFLADQIEAAALVSEKIGFNMGVYKGRAMKSMPDQTGHHCRTVACIAGWAVLMENSGRRIGEDYPFHAKARELLGLSFETASRLFTPHDLGSDWDSITQKRAVAVIRHLAKTGKVCWKLFDNEGNKIG